MIYIQRPGIRFIQTECAWEKYHFHVLPNATPILAIKNDCPVFLLYDVADVAPDEGYNVDKSKFAEYFRDNFVGPEAQKITAKNAMMHLDNLKKMLQKLGIFYAERNFGVQIRGRASYEENANFCPS